MKDMKVVLCMIDKRAMILIAFVLGVLLSSLALIPVVAKPENPGPQDIQQRIFIHLAGKGKPPSGERGYYKLLGANWNNFPVQIEVNLDLSNLGRQFALQAIHVAAEEWDDGFYSQSEGIAWYGVSPSLFADDITTTTKGYNDLAWTSGKRDGCNTIVWGDYPQQGVIAVTIIWYNTKTKDISEFDVVFDTDYAWGDAAKNPSVMDLQNIATHELGHGVGLDDLYQSPAYRETMYGYSDYGDIMGRDLYIGDKEGILHLYP